MDTPMQGFRMPSDDSSRGSTQDTTPTDYSAVINGVSRDVAIVGMACRVAGGNNSPEELWQYILDQKVGVGEMPDWRWAPYRQRDARNRKILDKTTSRGYFVDGVENFDATFFGISPKEAEQMDPQQRISLEVAWEALENAGIPPQQLAGSDTAVYWGVNSDDYSRLLLEDFSNVDAWMGINTAYCGVPNRISYQLDLMGPSTAVDAACASSLVAIHHGRQAILSGESKVAIVGGVNVMCHPGLPRVLDKAGAVSPRGCCRSFDDSADGYGRGEGAAAIILKNVRNAARDGDHILAILKGSAVAQDGRTNGIMVPNAKAQTLVANRALREADIHPSNVQYVEAHATSTPLGDPTEVSAIAEIYGRTRNTDQDACWIGSIKPNIGHLEAGAGAMGFIKTVLAVQKGVLPPQANLSKLNGKVNWEESNVRVIQESMEWPNDVIRRAGICSYGYGGTVSHAVIEQYSRIDHCIPSSVAGESHFSVLLLSAPLKKGIAIQAEALKTWLSFNGKQHDLRTISTTLATRRGHHKFRASLVVSNHDDAINALNSLAQGTNPAWTCQQQILPVETRDGAIWVFSGHGAQWKKMGQDLIDNPVFVDAIKPLDGIVRAVMGFSGLDALQTGDFDSSDKVQVITYLMQIGLSAVLQFKGIFPDAIIGHSVGEIAASVVAGGLSPEEGALIVCKRAALYRRVMGDGAMILVNKPYAEILQELEGRTDIVAAIDSSPSSCVVSGTREAAQSLRDEWSANGVKAIAVNTDIAFHSPMLDSLTVPLLDALKDLSPREPNIGLYSTSLDNARGDDLRDAHYWVNNMVNPVRLTSAVQAAVEDGYRKFIEISSHPVVCHSMNETIMDRQIEDFVVIPTMLRNHPADRSISHSIAQLHCSGHPVDWKKQMIGPWTSDVPTTAWDHKPVWIKKDNEMVSKQLVHDLDSHTLLGHRVSISEANITVYTTVLDQDTKPFPGSHPLHGTEIVPAACLINTFLHGSGAPILQNVILRVPVAIGAPRESQVVIHQNSIRLSSRLIQGAAEGAQAENSPWLTHTTATFKEASKLASESRPTVDIGPVAKRIGTRLPNDFSIQYLDKVGVAAMGFPWKVTEHWGNTKEMIAKVDVSPDLEDGSDLAWEESSWAPILDAATSIGSTMFFNEPRLRMPAQIDRVQVYTEHPPKTGWLYCRAATDKSISVDVSVLDDHGNVIAAFDSMRFSEIEGTPGSSSSIESLVHQISWPPAVLSENPLDLDKVVFISQDAATACRYAKNLPPDTEISHSLSVAELQTELENGMVLIYVPKKVCNLNEIIQTSKDCISDLLDIVKYVVQSGTSAKVFVLTNDITQSESICALAHSPLVGLSRIIASEHPQNFGGLIDAEGDNFPLQAIKYVHGADVVHVNDGVARVAKLRPFRQEKLVGQVSTTLPTAAGTYLITGGLGALGLEVASFLVEKGARRLVLVSRRGLPPRNQWSQLEGSLADTVSHIQDLEYQGASIHAISADVSDIDRLGRAIEDLGLPPVTGVVHAAGVLEDQLIMDSTADAFARVLEPKISGAIALHTLFPPMTLDFFMLFSSCGQLVGFPGQGSYASGNAFLDGLARYRRNLGDNSIAVQWTSWRGLGMAASTDYINAELEGKGITDVTRDDAFRAWEYLSQYKTGHAVILRCLALDEGEPSPHPILSDIVIRHQKSSNALDGGRAATDEMPKSGPQLKTYLTEKIQHCVAEVLQSSPENVDPRAALSDLGVDSVMTVQLRKHLQKSLKVTVTPTLTWDHPTVGHLASWYVEKMEEN